MTLLADNLPLPDSVQALETPQRQVYSVAEYEYVDVPVAEMIDAGRLLIYREVESKNYFTIRLRGSTLQVQAGGYVGLIALNDKVAIDVRPRVPVSNLSRMLHVAGYAPTALRFVQRTYETTLAPIDSLLDIYAESLLSSLETIQVNGVLGDYEHVREVTEHPRGRVLLHENITQQLPRGISHETSISWFRRVNDNAPNQTLKYAVWFLAARYVRMRSKSSPQRFLARRLNAAFRLFDGVTLDLRRRFLADRVVNGLSPLPRLRAYYRDALDLAIAIINEQAVVLDREGHDLRLSSLVLNMNDIFEDYLRSVLRTHAQNERWEGDVLDGNRNGGKRLFDTRPSVAANPDIVFVVRTGGKVAVPLLVEAKYKPAPVFPDRDDLNQVIAYGASYRAPKVVLAYPRGTSSAIAGLSLLGSIGGLTVHRYTFDLGAGDLAVEESAFAGALRRAAFGAEWNLRLR